MDTTPTKSEQSQDGEDDEPKHPGVDVLIWRHIAISTIKPSVQVGEGFTALVSSKSMNSVCNHVKTQKSSGNESCPRFSRQLGHQFLAIPHESKLDRKLKHPIPRPSNLSLNRTTETSSTNEPHDDSTSSI